jgi:hypothetical protein
MPPSMQATKSQGTCRPFRRSGPCHVSGRPAGWGRRHRSGAEVSAAGAGRPGPGSAARAARQGRFKDRTNVLTAEARSDVSGRRIGVRRHSATLRRARERPNLDDN